MYFMNIVTYLVISLLSLVCLNALNLKCDGKNESRVQSSALLYAHRCFIKDVLIKVPSPLNSILDSIVPSHVLVPRCSGNSQVKDYNASKFGKEDKIMVNLSGSS